MNLTFHAELAKIAEKRQILEHSVKLLKEQRDNISLLMEDEKLTDLEWGDLCADNVAFGKAIMQAESDISDLSNQVCVLVKKHANQ